MLARDLGLCRCLPVFPAYALCVACCAHSACVHHAVVRPFDAQNGIACARGFNLKLEVNKRHVVYLRTVPMSVYPFAARHQVTVRSFSRCSKRVFKAVVIYIFVTSTE